MKSRERWAGRQRSVSGDHLVGTILERDGSTYRVAAPGREIRAILRGKAKRETPRVVVGDRVRLELEAEGEVFGIVGVEPRTTLLERRVPEGRGTRPVAANIDEVFVVTATVDPAPIPQLIDRLLVVAEANSIPAAVVVNKVELDPAPSSSSAAAPPATLCTPPASKPGKASTGSPRHSRAASRWSPGRPVPGNPACSMRFSRAQAPDRRDQRPGTQGQEHHGLSGDVATRRGRLPGRYAGIQRSGALGHRASGTGQLLSRDAAVHRRVPLRRLPPHQRAGAAESGLRWRREESRPTGWRATGYCWRSWRARRRSGSKTAGNCKSVSGTRTNVSG